MTEEHNAKVEKSDDEWKQELTPEQYQVCRCGGTEPAFTGKYWDTKTPGKYLCAGCGSHLFDSATKYDSGSGWPSFWQPATNGAVTEKTDRSFGMVRTEIVCAKCESHLGHSFPDGPPPTGVRYCMNSASLNLIPSGDEK
ncbi:peptide-methionine (R)-S-oxide reductase MsrB [Kordiimonas aquimaris]|uniref:peptide-methionine (R)-S-oxide reductase MsrB n=1 Tax=Kordiimonas aquimaris TaxID=707591 RepID=UPI0021D2DC6C|nr:peptide-methionine (R)-S-oxide reductase MsrB [Kordiimonas aquimaris]